MEENKGDIWEGLNGVNESEKVLLNYDLKNKSKMLEEKNRATTSLPLSWNTVNCLAATDYS